MTAGVLAIGLDACEATLIERWAAEGRLPAFARLIETGASFRLGNSLETLPGAIWPEIATGISCGRLALFYHPRQLRTGEAVERPISPREVDPSRYYWVKAARAGRRVAALDQPQTVIDRGIDAPQLTEWGLHDRNFATLSHPPDLLQSIPRHPLDSCDKHGCTVSGYRDLLEVLTTGVDLRNDLLLTMLGDGHWDLLTAAYSETHCVGHQFWHFMDDPAQADAPTEFRDAIATVYRRIDDGIGRLLDAAGADARVLVYTSHGMGPYIGGPKLLDEVVRRLGLSSAGNSDGGAWLRRLKRMAREAPLWLQPALQALRSNPLLKAVAAPAGALPFPLESPRTRAITMQNNRCGAIRLNLAGREPYGSVAPGNEATALIETIREALYELEHPDNGERIVAKVVTADEAFGPDHNPDVPDIMVVFRDDLGTLEACRSPRVGEIRAPIFNPLVPRTGDHTVQSRLWAVGPGIDAGSRGEANVLDIAPTVLSLLGLPVPADTDGRPIPALAPGRQAAE